MGKVIVVGLSIATAWSIGCSGASGGVGTGAGGSTGTGGSAGEPVSTVALQGYVHESSGTEMSGVEVCQEGTPGSAGDACVQSGPDGSFIMAAVPANELASLTFHKDGFLPTRRSVLMGDQDVRLPQSDDSMLAATSPATFLGVAADPTRGHIAFQIANSDGNAPPVDVTLTGFDGVEPPPALSSDGSPAATIAAGAGGGFANVAPGTYVLRVGGASASCTASGLYGVPITAEQPSSLAAIAITVVAGYVTSPVVVSCARLQP
jgi:hypothetical protein